MYSNKIWKLVEPPDSVKAFGYKKVYNRKRGIDRKVETFKARLDEKGNFFTGSHA